MCKKPALGNLLHLACHICIPVGLITPCCMRFASLLSPAAALAGLQHGDFNFNRGSSSKQPANGYAHVSMQNSRRCCMP